MILEAICIILLLFYIFSRYWFEPLPKSYFTTYISFSENCKSFHIIYSTGLEYIDALLSDGSKYCLVKTKEKLSSFLNLTISPHSLTVFVMKDVYNEKTCQETINHLSREFVSVLQIKSSAQFGEIVGKCALQTTTGNNCKPGSAQNVGSCANIILKTVQAIPGLGPKQATKLVAKYGSIYNLTNATLGDLEIVLGQLTAMTVYQFLH